MNGLDEAAHQSLLSSSLRCTTAGCAAGGCWKTHSTAVLSLGSPRLLRFTLGWRQSARIRMLQPMPDAQFAMVVAGFRIEDEHVRIH